MNSKIAHHLEFNVLIAQLVKADIAMLLVVGSNPAIAFYIFFSIFPIFRGSKHHDSQKLTIPDLAHLNGDFMEKNLVYANSTPHIALKMSFSYSKTKYF